MGMLRFAAVLLLALAWGAHAQVSPPEGRPLVERGAWAGVLKEHPRLLGPRAFLRGLAAEKPQEYARLKGLEKNLLATGIVHAVEGAPAARIGPHIAEAMRNVERGPTNIHQDTWLWMEQVALSFDLFHDAIPAEQRAAMIAWLNPNLDSFTTDENAFHNSTLSKIFCYLRVAYATWGENPRAAEFRDRAIVTLYEGKVLPVLLEFGAGGGFTECGWYTRGALWHLVQGLELARRMEGYDGFAKAPAFFYSRLAYELHQAYPTPGTYGAEHYPVEGDGSNIYGAHTEYPRLTRTVLAQYFRGSELSRFAAARARRASSPEIAMLDFLMQERPEEPLPVDGMPLAHLAAGIGRVYARSDWTPEATWLRFECGDYFNQHQHFEAGNFEIFRHEPLATESGEYVNWNDGHAANWLIRTIAHNCVLIHQPDEPWRGTRMPREGVYANDGGQSNNPSIADNLEQWLRERGRHERGDIVAYENRPEFLYLAGDCTRAYAPSKARLVLRQIVFIRPHTFVILDRVTSTRPEYAKTWLLHCHNQPDIEGNRVRIENGQGRLFVQTLLPEAPRIDAIHGYTYGGQQYPAAEHPLNAAAHRWRVEVRPAAPAEEDTFLHVLSTEGPPAAGLTQERDTLTISAEGWLVELDAAGGGRVVVGGQAHALERGVKRGRFE